MTIEVPRVAKQPAINVLSADNLFTGQPQLRWPLFFYVRSGERKRVSRPLVAGFNFAAGRGPTVASLDHEWFVEEVH